MRSKLFFCLVMLLCCICCSAKCPIPKEDTSYDTQNQAGNSTYLLEEFNKKFFPQIMSLYKDIPSGDVLDVGAGYGEFTYYYLNHHKGKVFFNEISAGNALCFIEQMQPKKFKSRIKYLTGDIASDKIQSLIPNNSLRLVYAKHVLHMMNAKQTESYFKMVKSKLKENGIMIVFFENPALTDQAKMGAEIQKKIQSYPKDDEANQLNVIKNAFDKTELYTYKEHCSFAEWKNISDKFKLLTFPCILDRTSLFFSMFTSMNYYQLINPHELAYILKRNGFKNVKWNTIKDKSSFFMVAQLKKDNHKKKNS